MKISARNQFKGRVRAIKAGEINVEVELACGDYCIYAVVTEASATGLGLAEGQVLVALVKAPAIILVAGPPSPSFSTRNQLPGTVTALSKGGVNTEVALTLSDGQVLHAVVTNEAVLELGLRLGVAATAMFKASQVVLGLEAD